MDKIASLPPSMMIVAWMNDTASCRGEDEEIGHGSTKPGGIITSNDRNPLVNESDLIFGGMMP